jgi:hypothetical protein
MRNIYMTTGAGPATTIPPTVAFCTLARFFSSYVFIGAPDDLPTDDPELLDSLADLGLPEQPNSIQTLLHYVLEGFLKMANSRSAAHKPVLGGCRAPALRGKQPNRYARADLEQYRYDQNEVDMARSIQAYKPLKNDLRQVYRLARAAQLDYQGQRRDAWRAKHLALAEALLRVHQLGWRLCEIGGRWFAEVCLRQVFRELWEEQFVANVDYPEAIQPFLKKVRLPLMLRAVILRALLPDRFANFEVAPPFAEMVSAYEAGEFPQSLSTYVSDEEWAGKVPIRWV